MYAMRIKEGFELRQVCGQNIIIASGRSNIDFSKVINMNESASVMWRAVEGRDFEIDDLVNALTEAYDVDRQQALKDAQVILNEWISIGVV
ncbi:MAG TPA: PqqD family protein [Methanocorpusculum sp.]|nr:PqqD family protein [Methanocorpusculum sp.]